MPATWKLRKKKAQSCYSKIKPHRTKSNKEISHLTDTPTPRRVATISGGVPVMRSKSATNINAIISPEHHGLDRSSKIRPVLIHQSHEILDDFELDFSPTELSPNLITVIFDNGHKSFERTRMAHESMTLRNIITMICLEQGVDIANDLSSFSITASDMNARTQSIVDLNAPSTYYVDNTIEVRQHHDMMYTEDSTSCPEKMTIQFCLDFFDSHGITTIPCGSNEIDNSSHLPLAQTTEPILESSWEDLPIDTILKQSLDSKELAHQQALWELIHTEHSFLRQLEIIINIYMRSLELIRRQDLLTEVNYYNIFGYMEEIHSAHKSFWLSTLCPCLERVYMEHCPLDINDVIDNFSLDFAQDFEIYEQHCVFETTNLKSLNEAMKHADFRAYVKWCESQPECNRLRLKDFLAIPRQRLMKYQLLFKAILKKTTDQANIDDLKQITDNISMFVDSVNNVLKTQEESSRVEEVMKKITGYSPVEIPGDLKELVQPHTHLDLMAPMPDVDVTKTRILVLEGKLRFRDQRDKMVVHVFLFSDMLLITKPTVKRNVESYIVVQPPYKISNIQITLRGDAICCIVLSEFKVLSALFTLKAHSSSIAKEWVDQITAAQDFYNSALTRKVPTWHILDSLRQERILHGVSQDNDSNDSKVHTSSPLSAFQRVASNDSILSCNSSSAFPFDIKASPLSRRRGTLPCSYSASDAARIFRRSSNVPSSPSSPPNTPVGMTNKSSRPKWQRTASLNALPEGNMPLKNHSCPPKLQRNSINEITDHNFQRTSSLNLLPLEEISQLKIDPPLDSSCPMLEDAVPLQESDSNTDDEEQSTSYYSPVNSVFSPPATDSFSTSFRKHRRHKSQPTVSYVINTSTPDLTHTSRSESDDSAYHRTLVHRLSDYENTLRAESDSSLMNDIIKELSKTNSEVSIKMQEELGTVQNDENEETFDSSELQILRQRSMSLHSSVGNLEKRFHTRRKAIQLDNIFEITDEENDSKFSTLDKKNESSYFLRNTKLRRSKSSFELSFHRRLKPPSPLTTHIKRSSETINDHPLLCAQISSPLLLHRENIPLAAAAVHTEIIDEESPKHKSLRKHSLDIRPRKKLNKGKKTLSFSFFKKGKSLSPVHSKWRFKKGLKKFSALSMETGLDQTDDGRKNYEDTCSPSPPPPPPPSPPSALPPTTHQKLQHTHKNSPKVMLVVAASQKKKS